MKKEYLQGKSLHRKYFAQFVNDSVKHHLLLNISRKELLSSKDPYLNDIAMKRWDALGGFTFNYKSGKMITRPINIEPISLRLLKEAGEGVSASSLVCIYKEAAKQIIEENKK